MIRINAARWIRPLIVVLIVLALAGLAIALAPGSHHGHDSTSAALRESGATSMSDGILAQFPARFDR
jgi:hypothetical protein